MVEQPDLYAVLGLPRSATETEVRRAYRVAATRCHPDKPGGDAAAFASVQRAYDVLSVAEKRAAYDATGVAQRSADEELLDAFGGGACPSVFSVWVVFSLLWGKGGARAWAAGRLGMGVWGGVPPRGGVGGDVTARLPSADARWAPHPRPPRARFPAFAAACRQPPLRRPLRRWRPPALPEPDGTLVPAARAFSPFPSSSSLCPTRTFFF